MTPDFPTPDFLRLRQEIGESVDGGDMNVESVGDFADRPPLKKVPPSLGRTPISMGATSSRSDQSP
jgi:hypothetical protein